MVERVGIETFVDPRKSEAGAKRTNRALGSMEKSAIRTQKSVTGIGAAAKRVGILVAGALSVRQVIRYADSWTSVTNQLRIVTDGTEELANATDAVFQAAQETRQPVAELVTLYSRAALSADKLNASQAELAVFSENVGKALAVQGSNSAEARGALIQLSQAIGSGIVRAEEYNSVLEGARPILVAVAKGLKEAGGDVAKLRTLVTDGAVSSEAFFKAFLIGSTDLEEQFGTTSKTVSQGFTQIENSAIRFIGQLNQATGSSEAVSGALDGIRQTIDELDAEFISTNIDLQIKQWQLVIQDVVDELGSFENELGLVTDVAGLSADKIGESFKTIPLSLVAAIRIATVEAASFLDRADAKVFKFAAETRQSLVDGLTLGLGDFDVSSKDIADANRVIAASEQARIQTVDEILGKYNEQRDSLQAQIDAAKALSEERRKAREEERKAAEQRQKEALAALRGKGPISINDSPVTGEDGKETPAEKAAKRLETQAQNTLANLQRQIELYGDTSRAAEAAYDIASGKLAGINPQLARQIQLSAERLDQLDEQSLIEQQIKEIEESHLTPIERVNQAYQRRAELIEKAGLSEAKTQELLVKEAAKQAEEIQRIKDQEVVGFDAIFGEGSLKQLFSDFDEIESNFKGLLIRMAVEAAQAQVLQAFGQPTGGMKSFTDIFGAIGGFFGGGKANGGRFGPNELFPVNERGPELLTVGNNQYLMTNNARGNITPNEQISNNTTKIVNVTMPVIAPDPSTFRKASRQLVVETKRRVG